jgi:hypothetical protein
MRGRGQGRAGCLKRRTVSLGTTALHCDLILDVCDEMHINLKAEKMDTEVYVRFRSSDFFKSSRII